MRGTAMRVISFPRLNDYEKDGIDGSERGGGEPGSNPGGDSDDDPGGLPLKLRMQRNAPQAPARTRIDYESELNPQQCAAVTAPGGPVLVLAGAGSGKTRVITYRVAYLIETGIPASGILLTTFTNRAARSMLMRVENLLGVDLRSLTGGTFHSICNRLLRKYAPLIGYSEEFTILDEDDAIRLMKRVRDESGVDFSNQMFPAPRVLKRIASLMVNTETSLDDIIVGEYPQFARRLLDFEKVFAAYEAAKAANDAMDYDDLLLQMYRLLATKPEVRDELASRFQHVLVDEYQDTNHLQAKLIELWSWTHGNMFVVGDDAQSIYSFRGANYRNILSFPDRFPGTAIYKLETNYRSTPEILSLANDVLRDTPENFRKVLRSSKDTSARPQLVVCRSVDDQAEFVTGRILELREEGIGLNDIGVLYRAHRNSQEIEMALARSGIPYYVRGGVRFMEMAHIKDLMSYLFVLGAPRNAIAWDRVLSMCNRVGAKSVLKITEVLQAAQDPLGRFMESDIPGLAYGEGRTSIKALQVFLKDILAENPKLDPPSLAKTIYSKRYKSYMQSQYENASRREEDIDQFVLFASRFTALHEMLQEVALHGGFMGEEVAALNQADFEEGRVCLSTIHQAKGLEWKTVFLVWLVDGTMPHSMCFGNPDALEEERRVFYVAVTRAKDDLIMCYPQERRQMDFSIDLVQPSRYLKWVGNHLYDEFILEWDEPGVTKPEPPSIETSPFDIGAVGGKMLGNSSASKPGGVWMPEIPAPEDYGGKDLDDEFDE